MLVVGGQGEMPQAKLDEVHVVQCDSGKSEGPILGPCPELFFLWCRLSIKYTKVYVKPDCLHSLFPIF